MNQQNRRTKIHAIQAGRLRSNRTTMRGAEWRSLLRRRVDFEFPAYVYIIERPDGHLAIDTGLNAGAGSYPLPLRRVAPDPLMDGEEDEIGPGMRAQGLDPESVHTVILTHLDFDHIGGVDWFPNAEVLVHRPEYEFTSTILGKPRYRPELWPSGFDPRLYDLDPEPYGAFPRSKALGDDGDLRLVPIPGHAYGQVGVILRMGAMALFFTGDHVLRQDWFLEDWAAGRSGGLLSPTFWMKRFRQLGAETSRRIHRFATEIPTVLLPAHDADAPRRLEARETIHFRSNQGGGSHT
jgi:N-acyl homoserine lactone hydrolase